MLADPAAKDAAQKMTKLTLRSIVKPMVCHSLHKSIIDILINDPFVIMFALNQLAIALDLPAVNRILHHSLNRFDSPPLVPLGTSDIPRDKIVANPAEASPVCVAGVHLFDDCCFCEYLLDTRTKLASLSNIALASSHIGSKPLSVLAMTVFPFANWPLVIAFPPIGPITPRIAVRQTVPRGVLIPLHN